MALATDAETATQEDHQPLTLGAGSGGEEAALDELNDERLGVDVDRREVSSERFGLVAHLVRLVDLGGNVVGITSLELFNERLGARDVQRRLVIDAFVGATRTSERVAGCGKLAGETLSTVRSNAPQRAASGRQALRSHPSRARLPPACP